MMMITLENFFPLLKKYLPEKPLIIEAGAFNGRDTKRLSIQWPHGTIHAFEPVPEIFAELCSQTASYPNIHPYQVALSNATGSMLFYSAEHPKHPGKICQAGTLLKPKDRLAHSPITYPKTMRVPTITLDAWAIQHGIDHVDFLWLDLQGHELAALQGASKLLKRVTAAYLEVNFIEAYEGQPTYQAIDKWMRLQGFNPIAKDFSDEKKWFFGNILYRRN